MVLSKFLRRTWVVAVLAATVLAPGSRASAIDGKIPYPVVTATTALSPSQIQQLETYLDQRINQLIDGTDDQIPKARRELIEPLTWAGSTEIFHLAYSYATANRLSKAIESDRMLVRLNAMIVVNSLNNPGVVRLIEKGLADPSPAVRYWAGKAVNQTMASKLAVDQQQALLDALTKAMFREKTERVLQRLLVGVVGLNIPEAATKLLDSLNQRVAMHAVNPRMPLGAALEGLRTLFVKTVEANANGQDASVETIRKMAMVAYRYMELSAALLDMGRSTNENQSNYREMVKLADAILRWTVRQMPPDDGASAPPAIKSDINTENWPLVRLRTEEWKRLLTHAPFGFGPVNLMVTIPENP